MQNTISLLDKYKKTCAIASDNACAAALGVTRATVSRWRTGQGNPEADARGDLEKARVWLRLANEATDEALGVPGRSAA